MTENVLKPDKSYPAWSWLALRLISGIGYKKIQNLIEHISSAEDILEELSLISATATNLPLSPEGETGFKKINPDDFWVKNKVGFLKH